MLVPHMMSYSRRDASHLGVSPIHAIVWDSNLGGKDQARIGCISEAQCNGINPGDGVHISVT